MSNKRSDIAADEIKTAATIEIDGVTPEYIEINLYVPDFLRRIHEATGVAIYRLDPRTISAFLDRVNDNAGLVVTMEAKPKRDRKS